MSDKAVGRFNKFERQEVNDLFRSCIFQLNASSIAKVCLTDTATVENVLQEFIAQYAHAAKEGRMIRLNFKVGYLTIKNRLLQWNHSAELLTRHGLLTPGQKVLDEDLASTGKTRQSHSYVNYSVATPSQAQFSRSDASVAHTFHVSNPNPQSKPVKFRGVRETAANKAAANAVEQNQLDSLKFGKKVIFGQQINNKDVLEDHLR